MYVFIYMRRTLYICISKYLYIHVYTLLSILLYIDISIQYLTQFIWMFLCRMSWFRFWDAFGSFSWGFNMDWLERFVLKLLCFTVQPQLKDLDQESQRRVREVEEFQETFEPSCYRPLARLMGMICGRCLLFVNHSIEEPILAMQRGRLEPVFPRS